MGAIWSFATDTSPLRFSYHPKKVQTDKTIKDFVRRKKKYYADIQSTEKVPNLLSVATSAHSLCLVNNESDLEHKVYYHCLMDHLNYSQLEALCLCKHNVLRFRHKVPALKLNCDLSKLATDWAQRLAEMKTIKESPYPEYGENMCFSKKTDITIDTIVQHWYDEIEAYDFRNPSFSEDTGHFTQIIWRNTKELGVGLATNEKGSYVVILYCPPGNFDDHFYDNIPPPSRNFCYHNVYYDNKI